MLYGGMEAEWAAPAGGQSLRWVWDELEYGGNYFGDVPAGGYRRLVGAMASGVDVRLGRPVSEIAASPDGVRVVTADGTAEEGSHVVVTVPLGVLKRGVPRFSPALPRDRLAAIGRLGFGRFEKVALRFAAERPEAVASLFLSGCGLRAPRTLRVRRLAMRPVPERFFTRESAGAGKSAAIESNRARDGLDLSDCLPRVRARTLVTCGARDTRRHRADAQALSEGIHGAELRIIPGAGHLWNRERPELFARTLMEWVLDRPLTGQQTH